MKQINRDGPIVRGFVRAVPPPAPLAAANATALADDGALVIDMRSAPAFAAGHPSGAMNIGFGPRVGYWAGWLVPPATPLILLASDAVQAEQANRQLLRTGFDDVVGHVHGGFEAWQSAGGRVSHVEIIDARELRDRLQRRERLTLVDVRTPAEWRSGHINEAVNIPISELPKRAVELRGQDPVATVCETGFRSSLASSLLVRAGVHAINVSDGTAAYRLLD